MRAIGDAVLVAVTLNIGNQELVANRDRLEFVRAEVWRSGLFVRVIAPHDDDFVVGHERRVDEVRGDRNHRVSAGNGGDRGVRRVAGSDERAIQLECDGEVAAARDVGVRLTPAESWQVLFRLGIVTPEGDGSVAEKRRRVVEATVDLQRGCREHRRSRLATRVET